MLGVRWWDGVRAEAHTTVGGGRAEQECLGYVGGMGHGLKPMVRLGGALEG